MKLVTISDQTNSTPSIIKTDTEISQFTQAEIDGLKSVTTPEFATFVEEKFSPLVGQPQ